MPSTPIFDLMVGQCEAMHAVFSAIEKLATTDLTVLILGETGTGKELVARSLHARGPRSRGPFVAINCAAIPTSLMESELFGFEKGSFTGAVGSRIGHIEQADGGTLFLDEVADMPLSAQAKLLRVLQDHRVARIGSSRDHSVDVRVIAATHQDLHARVDGRAFRTDLYHRLNQVPLLLPPLRERGADIELIAESVLQRVCRELGRRRRFSDATRAALREHDWPGNVRELENCVQRAAAVGDAEVIEPADLALRDGGRAGRRLADIVARATEAAIRDGLRHHAGDAAGAARELGVTLDELRRLAERAGIQLGES
jgi:transcriptional regulator with GAF, ATPase, and Fis domain